MEYYKKYIKYKNKYITLKNQYIISNNHIGVNIEEITYIDFITKYSNDTIRINSNMNLYGISLRKSSESLDIFFCSMTTNSDMNEYSNKNCLSGIYL